MAGMGPAPSANPRRRNARADTVYLPATGRPGKAPRWPLSPDAGLGVRARAARDRADRLAEALPLVEDSKLAKAQEQLEAALVWAAEQKARLAGAVRLERRLWTDLWTTPQAAQWERLSWHREVALYVRHQARAELGDLEAAREARMRSDRLGLTPLAQRRLGWVIEDAVEAEVVELHSVDDLLG